MPVLLRKLLLAAVAVSASGVSQAYSSPIMVSLLTPVQLPSREYDVAGFKLSLLYGDCRDFMGFDIGVVSRSAGEFNGLGVGGVNVVNGRFRGLQVGLVNWSGCADTTDEGCALGVQYGGINIADSFFGLQSGYVNVLYGALSGAQCGYVNCANDMHGVQCGGLIVLGVNVAWGAVSGCQIGIFNYAQRMDYGVQIGILNIIANNGLLPVLPIVNGGF